jgi:ATP-binding cassette subfamily F protein uup
VEDWLTQSRRARALAAEASANPRGADKAAKPIAAPTPPASSAPAPAARRKLSYKEQRELESLPGLIEALETEQKGIAGQLADGSLYATQPAQATALAQRSSEIDDALLAAMERWESLGAGAA